ncbi:hypothetical protein Rhe02_55500 [Rhizocola hellebori]|uniref:Uncharacterized protein n=1 Tax=Rhizocola hellebori TaxID=1392758 RepID=A0A8J3VIZ8_9ACTN|nr:hypothetical protein [Rhizocola hellebori]GIH07483.1 hypothetical protein Rhe02_55500 [Rhizocola hellebori]
MTQDAANDLLMNGGGGTKSAKFNTLGDVVRGTITDDPKVTQCVKFDDDGKPTDEKAFWKSGDPMMQIVVTIQTDQRDPDDEDDDGKRALHITPRLQPAVRDAVKTAGAKGLAIGGIIAVQWTGGTGHGKGNARQYAAAYQPPQVGADLLSAPPATTVQPTLTAAAPAVTAPPVAAAPPSTIDLLKASTPAVAGPPAGSNIDPNVWAALPNEQRAAILAAMGLPF